MECFHRSFSVMPWIFGVLKIVRSYGGYSAFVVDGKGGVNNTLRHKPQPRTQLLLYGTTV